MSSAAVAGGLGGACVPCAKVLTAAGTAFPTMLQLTEVVPAMVLMAFIGAVVAAVSETVTPRQALMIGIAAPGLINSAISGTIDQSAKRTPPQAAIERVSMPIGLPFAPISEAAAQEAPPSTAAVASPQRIGRRLIVTPVVVGGMPEDAKLTVTAFVGGADGRTASVPLGAIDPAAGPVVITVPVDTRSVTVGSARVDLSPVFSEQPERLAVTVVTAPKPGSDFYWALGGRRSFEVKSISSDIAQ